MSSRRSKILWFGVTLLIFAGLIYFSNYQKFLDALLSAKPLYLVPAFGFGFSVLFVLALTWHRFLRKVGLEGSYFTSFKLFMSGQFMNSITPLGQFGGEPFMAYVIKRNTDLSYEKSFSTVLSADIVNAIPVFTFILGGSAFLLLFGSVNDLILQAIYAGVLLTVFGGFLVYLLWFKAGVIEGFLVSVLEMISGLIGRGEKIVEEVEERMEEVQEAFASIGEDPYHLFETAIIAHLYFLFQVLSLYFILLSLGVQGDLTSLYFVLAISGLSNFTPTPGGSGAYEATMSGLLVFFLSINIEIAVAAAILSRMMNYWPGILVGYLSLLSVERGK